MNAAKVTELSSSPTPGMEITYRGKDSVIAISCARCGAIFTPGMFGGGPSAFEAAAKSAADHCAQRYCRCGAKISKSRVLCNNCWDSDQNDRDQRKFELAEKVPSFEYGDPVYWEGHEGSMGDGYFSSLDEVVDYCEDNDISRPSFVWACTRVPLSIDTGRILESAFDEHFEGAMDMLQEGASAELQTFLHDWCQKQNIESWQTDYRRAVLLMEDGGGEDGTGDEETERDPSSGSPEERVD